MVVCHMFMCACVQAYVQACVHACVHACVLAYMYAYLCESCIYVLCVQMCLLASEKVFHPN